VPEQQESMETRGSIRILSGVVMLAVAAFLVASLFTYCAHEGPFPDFAAAPVGTNACGLAGAYVSAYAFAIIGGAAYLIAAALAIGAAMLISGRCLSGMLRKTVGLGLLGVGAVLGLAVLNASPESTAGYYEAAAGPGGGAAGILLAGWLYKAIGSTGTLILCLLLCAGGVFLMAGSWVMALCRVLAAAHRSLVSVLGGALHRRRSKRRAAPVPAVEDVPTPLPLDSAASVPMEQAVYEEPDEDETIITEPEYPEPQVITRYSRAEMADDAEDIDYDMVSGASAQEHGDYCLPGMGLLDDVPPPPVEDDEGEIRSRGRMIESRLSEFGIGVRVVAMQRGPVITMYELSLAPGTKLSRVGALADDLAIALKAPNVRIVAPLPGKNTVGVEVPNANREVVGIHELMTANRARVGRMAIPLFLGKDTAGEPLVLDLATCPHLLVAGATGSGKSVAINAMIMSILMTRTPEEVQLLLIDPKSVEFSNYSELPHLICPVLTDMKKAAMVLKWACKKMDDRYSLLSSVGVRDLKGYNRLGEDEIRRRLDPEGEANLDDVPFDMPHIVIIVDEFGELMMVAAKEVESSVIRLSQKARAVGIHLICATQRPSVDVITGLIKSNLPARIAFQVASKVDSRTILDRNGADLLLGRGDMLLLPPGTSGLVRAQGSYVSEEEIGRVVEFLKEQGAPQFRAELQEYHAQQQAARNSDDLFEDAVRVVLESQRGSVSLLQRRLSVGFSRAARLIDMMAEAGIVGPYAGSQARRVLMTLEQWDRAREQAS